MVYKYCPMCGSTSKKDAQGHFRCDSESCGYTLYINPKGTVTGLILYKNKLLLARRGGDPFKGWWDIPGGFMEPGERPEDTLIREMKEETGLTVRIRKFLGGYPGTYELISGMSPIITFVYIAYADSEKLLALDDIVESRWFSKNELPKEIAFDSNQDILKDFLPLWKND